MDGKAEEEWAHTYDEAGEPLVLPPPGAFFGRLTGGISPCRDPHATAWVATSFQRAGAVSAP